MPASLPVTRHAVTRRTALVAALGTPVGTVALAACDADDLRPHDATPTLTPSASPGQPTPDERLVAEVVATVQGAAASVAAARRVPALRARLGPLLRVHRRHLAVLDPASDGASSSASSATAASSPTGLASTVLAGVLTLESGVETELATASARAESGTLAALLAAMSASIAQHVVAVPTVP